jgi:hypothetical protein
MKRGTGTEELGKADRSDRTDEAGRTDEASGTSDGDEAEMEGADWADEGWEGAREARVGGAGVDETGGGVASAAALRRFPPVRS